MTDPKGLPLSSCIYGLRNLAVGDEEETRIDSAVDEIEDAGAKQAVQDLIEKGKFVEAYELAMKPTLETASRNEVVVEACCFAAEFEAADNNGEGSLEERSIALTSEIMSEYDRLMKIWTAADPF